MNFLCVSAFTQLETQLKATFCQFVAQSWEERDPAFCQLDWPQPTLDINSLCGDSTTFLATLKEKSQVTNKAQFSNFIQGTAPQSEQRVVDYAASTVSVALIPCYYSQWEYQGYVSRSTKTEEKRTNE